MRIPAGLWVLKIGRKWLRSGGPVSQRKADTFLSKAAAESEADTVAEMLRAYSVCLKCWHSKYNPDSVGRKFTSCACS